MRSDARSELLDLERGLPTSEQDVAVQRRLRQRTVGTKEFLAFLAALGEPSREALRARKGPRGEPFRLSG